MKKKILGGIAVLAIAVVTAFNVNINTQEDTLSAITLDNVEALAGKESNDNQNSCKWKTVSCGIFSGNQEVCLTTGDGNSCTCGHVSRDC